MCRTFFSDTRSRKCAAESASGESATKDGRRRSSLVEQRETQRTVGMSNGASDGRGAAFRAVLQCRAPDSKKSLRSLDPERARSGTARARALSCETCGPKLCSARFFSRLLRKSAQSECAARASERVDCRLTRDTFSISFSREPHPHECVLSGRGSAMGARRPRRHAASRLAARRSSARSRAAPTPHRAPPWFRNTVRVRDRLRLVSGRGDDRACSIMTRTALESLEPSHTQVQIGYWKRPRCRERLRILRLVFESVS